MKNILTSSLRAAALASTLFALAVSARADDRAAQVLSTTGSVKIESVGPYVSTGTYRVQVSAKLGRPTSTLPDGTWIYENFNASDSTASGALVVRFTDGRVSSLSLATPATVVALRTTHRKGADRVLIAAWNH